MMLGGAEEIGANSCYLNIAGIGLLIDAGLHPRRRDALAFPQMDLLGDRPVDAFVLTHAHTDHLGGVPFMMKKQPHARMITTRPTRDLIEIMLRNTIKLLKIDNAEDLGPNALALYDRKILDKLSIVFEGFLYEEEFNVSKLADRVDAFVDEITAGKTSNYANNTSNQADEANSIKAILSNALKISFHDAGHIIGSAGVKIQAGGASIMHSGDVQFGKQALLPGASLPRHHHDILIIESTNGADENPRSYKQEKERLAKFINDVTANNGSVLLPVFALGKTQEVLKIVSNLMNSGKIPRLPIYTGGMSKRVSKVYDRYCYAVPRVEPGFELADIPQVSVMYEDMMSGKYFNQPGIVIISSGMLNEGSPSYQLAQRWMDIGHFGIGIMGYQDPSAPGSELLQSERGKPFTMAGKETTRKCDLERFRFSAHSSREQLLNYIFDVKPKHLFLVHGEMAAVESMGAAVKAQLPQTKVYAPQLGKSYHIEIGKDAS
jgi:Cft2 family RNA processing exonuclease